MQIEKINDNKLEVILSVNDLKDNNIDIHSFWANSSETQDLFFNILDLAEENFDFVIEEDKFIVESFNLNENLFLITITKLNASEEVSQNPNSSLLYKADSFEDFYELTKLIKQNDLYHNVLIYQYNDFYFFVLKKFNNQQLLNFFQEYCTYEKDSHYMENILFEHGIKIEI